MQRSCLRAVSSELKVRRCVVCEKREERRRICSTKRLVHKAERKCVVGRKVSMANKTRKEGGVVG